MAKRKKKVKPRSRKSTITSPEALARAAEIEAELQREEAPRMQRLLDADGPFTAEELDAKVSAALDPFAPLPRKELRKVRAQIRERIKREGSPLRQPYKPVHTRRGLDGHMRY